MSKTTDANIAERQAEIGDAIKIAERIVAALHNAESCETPTDFDANVADTKDEVKLLLAELSSVVGR